ncbi:winged helix-turn-helix domain-containing protein [Qipengyuania sp. 1NDH17]|uniref:Winged helix-turn-helix domain-containing protein n=1 Tax=Qipengyuania polymorpha TaxID=2867234 RepID=A0ABS7IXY4_9SPHN|nr:winged helix-turn-helix domain-containing protein [Qipengyuania polymorpha]MBX7458248.1 winged helix-turn-helix domain-containing protein [Qipengyuania polymorpha]
MTEEGIAAEQRVQFDRYLLDREDERVVGPQGPVHLGHKAYQVLEALIECDGKLLTKDTLFETVWDGTHVSESALTSVIKELRRALGDTPRNSHIIESVYGRGYRLVAPIRQVAAEEEPLKATELVVEDAPVARMGTRPWEISGLQESRIPRELPESLSSKPSIAVVPFQQVGEKTEPWFPDAVADEITVALARFGEFFVLSSVTSLHPENRDRPPQEVAEELGVRYFLSGTIQRFAQRVRFIAHLDDVIEKRMVWTEKFDEDLDDIFELQDRIAGAVARNIGVSISDAEAYRARHQPSRDIRDIYYQANLLIRRIEPKSIATVLTLAERALELEPENSWAAAMAALANGFQFLLGWTSDREMSRERTIRYCEIALKDPGADERVFGLCGPALNCVGHKIELAHQLTDKAIEINPCDAGSLIWGSWMDVTAGNAERGIERAKTSLAVNPKSGIGHLIAIPHAIGLIQLGRYEEAADMLEKVVEISPQGDALAALAIALVKLERVEEARDVYSKLDASGGAIGGLALMRVPEHQRMVEECLAIASAE